MPISKKLYDRNIYTYVQKCIQDIELDDKSKFELLLTIFNENYDSSDETETRVLYAINHILNTPTSLFFNQKEVTNEDSGIIRLLILHAIYCQVVKLGYLIPVNGLSVEEINSMPRILNQLQLAALKENSTANIKMMLTGSGVMLGAASLLYYATFHLNSRTAIGGSTLLLSAGLYTATLDRSQNYLPEELKSKKSSLIFFLFKNNDITSLPVYKDTSIKQARERKLK